jgi:intein/homing endonuclease
MPNLNVVTITLPNFEVATYLGSLALSHAVDYMRVHGLTVDDLAGEDAVRTKVLDSLSRNDSVFMTGVGHGNCYSEDTEILTENGWKKFYALEVGEKVATLNPQTGELEYQAPIRYYKFRYKGKMLLINGKRINLLVTSNHKLYVSWMGRVDGKLTWRPYSFIEAEAIGKAGHINEFVVDEERVKLYEEAKRLNAEGKSVDEITRLVKVPKPTVFAWLHYGQNPSRARKFKSTGTTTGNCLKFKRGAKWNCEAMEVFRLPSVEVSYRVPHYGRLDEYAKAIPCKKVKIEDWLRFFGIWLAEGSASLGDRKGVYIISIAQNNDEKRRIFKEWVNRVGEQVGFKAWEEASNEHSKTIKFKNKQIYEYLKQFGHAKEKFIPKEIKMLPPYLLRILLEAMVLGDGYINKRGEILYGTASKRLADDVQEIAMKIGMGATMHKDKKTSVFTVCISDDEVCLTKKSMKWIDYDGYVYCVEVPNHLLYVRRNGKPCWCGNSTTFTGQNYDRIWWSCDCSQLRGRVVFLLSCLTGQQLGPDMVNNKGAWCYAGYKVEFTWIQEARVDPLADKYGKAFFEPVLELIYSLADGHTMGEAFRASVDKWNYWIDYWSRSSDPEAAAMVMYLIWDRDGQVLIGDESAAMTSAVPWPWWLLMGLGFAPVGAVISIAGTEELRKLGVLAV